MSASDKYGVCSKCNHADNIDPDAKYCRYCGALITKPIPCNHYKDGCCMGTKEVEQCSCGGNKLNCDFYSNEEIIKRMANTPILTVTTDLDNSYDYYRGFYDGVQAVRGDKNK